MKIRLLLVVRNNQAQSRYCEVLNNLGVDIVTSSGTNDEFLASAGAFHGICEDLGTKIAILQERGLRLSDLNPDFPTCQLRVDTATGDVLCYSSLAKKHRNTLADFIDDQCQKFSPRDLSVGGRSALQRRAHFHLTMDRVPAGGVLEYSTTTSFGPTGCFIFSVCRWEIGDDLSLIVRGMEDHGEILATVREVVKWGTPGQLPGIEVEFRSVTERQRECLDAL